MIRYIDTKVLENMREKMIALTETADDDAKIVLAIQISTLELLIDCPENIYADAEEVRHGEWIDTGSGQKCSVCGEIQYGYDNYRYRCSYCGAKMDKEKAE